MKRFFIFLFIIALTNVSVAEPKGIHTFVGWTNNFVFPGTVRFGHNDWEVGLLADASYGYVKRHYFKPSYYTGFGFVLAGTGSSLSGGFVGSMGFDCSLVGNLGFRGEIMALGLVSGYVTSRGAMGLSYYF